MSGFSASVSDLSVELKKYTLIDSEFNLDSFTSKYDDMCESFDAVYEIRFEFDKADTERIESINDAITDKMSAIMYSIEKSEGDSKIIALYDFERYLSEISNDVNRSISRLINKGNGTYYTHKITIYISIAVMILALIGFAAMAVYVTHYIKRRVGEPLVEVSEWAKQFEDNYSGMDDLEYDTDDEIGALCKSFNIVKNNLAQASELKKENEAALRKLQNEEANKMKFVKQLYNEKREKETISSEAKRDGLTGLYNRRSFDSLIEDFVANKPNDTEGALFLIDMDYFKNVNDTLGHLAGDEVLKTLAGAMRMVFPAGYLGRYGGDEFIAFVTGVTSEEDLDRFGKELCKKMDREYESGGKSVKISVSVGISGTEGIDDYSELYMKADKALYHSKENGRNQYTIASKLPD
jgi:diguanylate cyclase (GGDEF)-like protein